MAIRAPDGANNDSNTVIPFSNNSGARCLDLDLALLYYLTVIPFSAYRAKNGDTKE